MIYLAIVQVIDEFPEVLVDEFFEKQQKKYQFSRNYTNIGFGKITV